MNYGFRNNIRVLYDIRESYAPVSPGEKEKQDIEIRAKNFVQELVIELIQEKDKTRWREIFKSHEQGMKNSPRTQYKGSRFEVHMNTLSQHLFGFGGILKSNPEEGLNRFIKSSNLDIKVISEKKNDSREFTKEEEKIVREFSGVYLKEIIRRGVALTKLGDVQKKVIIGLKDELTSRYPGLPRKELDTFISNLEISIQNDEETFAGTSMKAKAYEGLNWAMKNIDGVKDIQDWVSVYLKKNGYNDRIPSNNEKLIIVENIYNGLPTITKKALGLVGRESVASNLIRAFIDMFYDARRVTIAGGEFKNTAENAILEIANNVSTKKKGEVTTVGVLKNDTKSEDLSDIFKNGVANVDRKKFQSIILNISDPIGHLKKTIGQEKYKEFCLYAQSMEYRTKLFKDMDPIFTTQVKRDAEKFELTYRGTIGKIQNMPKGISIETLGNTLRKVPKERIEEYINNPSIVGLSNIIRESGVSENQVNTLLEELKKAIAISLEMNKKGIAETKKDILEKTVKIGNEDIKLKNIAKQRDAEEILSTQKNLDPEIREYLEKVIQQIKLQKSSAFTGYGISDNVGAVIYQSNSRVPTPQEKKRLEDFEEKGISVKNIAGIRASNDVLSITNNLPSGIDITDPWQVEEALKNNSLTPDQLKAMQLIQRNHKDISGQIELFRDAYGEDATKDLLKNSLFENKDKAVAEKIMNKYAYLEQNVYEKSTSQSVGVDNQIANMTHTSDDIFVRTLDISGGSTISYRVGIADNPYKRDIKNEQGEVIIKDVPFYGVSSTIKELVLIAGLGIDNIGGYLPILNRTIRQRIGKNVDPMDKTFSQREGASVISALLKLFKFNPPPKEMTNNAADLRNYFLQQRNSLPHSLKYQGTLAGLYDTDGNTNETRFAKSLESIGT